MRWRIAGMCGASFGAWAMTVLSTLPISQPAARTRRAASASRASESAPAELRVGVGEVAADVAQRRGAEQRVGDGVAQRIGIRVAEQAVAVRDLDAAQHQPAPGDERVRVPALADAPLRCIRAVRCSCGVLQQSFAPARSRPAR